MLFCTGLPSFFVAVIFGLLYLLQLYIFIILQLYKKTISTSLARTSNILFFYFLTESVLILIYYHK